ncbi:MAG: hypothetical protein U0531_05345, partial [Dehalococcoidia bacterium]
GGEGAIARGLGRGGRRPKARREVALHVVRLACDVPDLPGRSLSQGDCTELGRQLHHEGTGDGTAASFDQILAKAEAALPPTPSLPEAA